MPPTEVDSLIEAALFFNIAYPEAVGIGNADADEFADTAYDRWDKFEPRRERFEKLLGRFEAFDQEWITVAQVLWQNHRWSGKFHEEAACYFLQKAITLRPKIPIHYLNFVDIYQTDKKQEIKLQSPLGVTHFYLAEYLFYFKKDYVQALKHYSVFVKEEPSLLPNNTFELDGRFEYQRVYPASTQEGLTQIARIHMLCNHLDDAKAYLQQAIESRPDNFQAPFELLAEINIQEGKVKEAIELLLNKIKAMKKKAFYIVFDPNEKEGKSLFHESYSRTKTIYLYEFKKRVGELLLQMSQYEAAEHHLSSALETLSKTSPPPRSPLLVKAELYQALLQAAIATQAGAQVAKYRKLLEVLLK